MKAIIACNGGIAAIQDTYIPVLADGLVLVKVRAIALNPTDYKHIDFGWADPGTRIGCDYSGVVESLGNKVTKFKKGSRVAGMVHGGDRMRHEHGAFAEYIIANPNLQLEIPEFVSYEAAATLGVAVTTIGQALYKTLQLPLPSRPTIEPFPILIHAASTATGMLSIRFAKASGLTVIATCSPCNFDKLRMLGADMVLDYRSPTCASEIKDYTRNKLKYAWDCIGKGVELCAAALSDAEPSSYVSVDLFDEDQLRKLNPNIQQFSTTMAYDALGEEYVWNEAVVRPRHDELMFATIFWELTQSFIASGVIKPVVPLVNRTGIGLEGAIKGLDELRKGNVSGAKLAYTLCQD